MHRKIYLSFIFALVTLGASAGSANDSKHSNANGAKKSSSVLRLRLTADPETLDWTMAHTSHATYLIMNLMEGLVEHDSKGNPVPALAESWKKSKDKKTITFVLRKNIRWSDGSPLLASQFVNSWIRLLSPKTKSPYAHFLFDILNAKEFHSGKIKKSKNVGISAPSENTFVIKLNNPTHYFLHIPTFWVTFPIHKKKNVTLGPYQLKNWNKKKSITLIKNPNYRKNISTAPDVVEARIVESDIQARELFYENQFDFLLNANTTDLLLAKQKKLKTQFFPYFSTYYLGFNVKRSRTRNLFLRKAIAQAIDPKKISLVLQGGQKAALGWVPPQIQGSLNTLSVPYSDYGAKRSLVMAGYQEGKDVGALSLTFERFDGAEVLAKYIVDAIQSTLKIPVKVRVEGPVEFNKRVKKGESDLFVTHWGADFADPVNFYRVFLPQSGTNYPQWVNFKYEEFIEKAVRVSNSTQRIEYFEKAEKLLLQDEVVIVPLFYPQKSAILGSRVETFELSPLNYLFFSKIRLKLN